MNFVDAEGETNIPILKWKWGYVYFWLCALTLSLLVLLALYLAGMLRATKKSNKSSKDNHGDVLGVAKGNAIKQSVVAKSVAWKSRDGNSNADKTRKNRMPNKHVTFRGSAKTHPETVNGRSSGAHTFNDQHEGPGASRPQTIVEGNVAETEA